jgi:hypothetical protein
MTGLGVLPVEPPIAGPWPFAGFPQSVEIAGATFNRACWAWPYSGVAVQYRQDVPTSSMHLLVYRNGTYMIAHADEWNPDLGFAVEHAVVDAPLATGLVVGTLSFAVGLVAGLLAFKGGQ